MKRLLLLILFAFSTAMAQAPKPNDTCFSPAQDCGERFTSFLKTAHKSINMAIYDLTLSDVADLLISKAKSGIRVRVVVDAGEAHTRGSQVARLVHNNVKVEIGSQDGIMHNKFTVVDGAWLETGSFNYSERAESKNNENQVYLTAKPIVASFEHRFNQLWATGLPGREVIKWQALHPHHPRCPKYHGEGRLMYRMEIESKNCEM